MDFYLQGGSPFLVLYVMKKLKDLGYVYTNKDHRKVHKFLCDCGNIKEIPLRNVLSKNTKSCGCLRKENKYNFKHGLKKHRLYNTYTGMIRRCHSKDDNNYKDYGGRGITVCDRWKDIKTFVSDMSSSHKNGLTLDRIDNDGNYCKENCRWATPKQQTRNKRVNVVYKGECAVDAAKRLGGCKSLVIMRIWRSKWSLEKAFNTPIQNI